MTLEPLVKPRQDKDHKDRKDHKYPSRPAPGVRMPAFRALLRLPDREPPWLCVPLCCSLFASNRHPHFPRLGGTLDGGGRVGADATALVWTHRPRRNITSGTVLGPAIASRIEIPLASSLWREHKLQSTDRYITLSSFSRRIADSSSKRLA